MHYGALKPKKIQEFIEEYRRGNKVQYYYCKEDTQEAIDKLHSLSYEDYADIAALFEWFIQSFLLRPSPSNSFYRAFLTLYNDEILNFRLSRHYATEKSTHDAFMRYGQPDIEYHLVIERVPSTSSSPPIASNTVYLGTAEVIFEIKFNDFKNNDGWKTFAKDLIFYLTYGKDKGIIENKQYKTNTNMKRRVSLTESDLHRIVKESVKSILNEFDWFGMQKEHQPIEARQYLPQNVRHRFVIGKNGNFVYRDADYNEHDTGINPSRVAQLSSDGKCNEKGLQAIGQALNNFNNRNVKNIESNLDSSNRAMANFNREKAERDAYEAQRNKEWAQQDAAAQRNYANKQYGYQRGMGRSSIY